MRAAASTILGVLNMSQKSMSTAIETLVADSVLPASGFSSPQAARALFWRARYLQEAAILQHLPFLFWLLGILRPRRYVETGMTDAVSYFAVCQAMDKTEPDAACTGIWHQTGEARASLPDGVNWRNTEFYAEFSQILTGPLAKFANGVRDGSIDLLLVNWHDDDSAINSFVQDWTSKLSKRAVVVVHGTSRPGFEETPSAVLLRDLGTRCPTLHFDGGDGLTVLLWGAERQEQLLALANLSQEDSGYSDVRQVFQRLGAAHQFEWKNRKNSQHLRDQQRDLDHLQKLNIGLTRELEENALLSEERGLENATMQAQIHDLEVQRKTWEDEAKQQIAALEAQREEQAVRLQEAEAGHAERLQESSREFAVLIETLETERQKNLALREEAEAFREESTRNQAEREEQERIHRTAEDVFNYETRKLKAQIQEL
ncbi:MAG: hypothetical protein DI498_08635, partial [Paracoccus denitrificans]